MDLVGIKIIIHKLSKPRSYTKTNIVEPTWPYMLSPVAWSANPSQSVDMSETDNEVVVGEEPCIHMLPRIGRLIPGVLISLEKKLSNCSKLKRRYLN